MFISFSEWAAKNVFATGKALNNEKKMWTMKTFCGNIFYLRNFSTIQNAQKLHFLNVKQFVFECVI